MFISPIAVVFISRSERVTCRAERLLEDFYVSRALQPIFEQQEKRMGYPPPWRFLGGHDGFFQPVDPQKVQKGQKKDEKRHKKVACETIPRRVSEVILGP